MADEEPGQLGEEQLGEGEIEHHEEEVVEEEQEPEESVLTEYDPDDFLSGAINSLDSTIPLDFLEFEYSFGYNCLKYFNLCACDETVICWSAGSIITFMDVKTKQTWFRRSTTGGSVGNITSYRVDPNYRIAIAEGREGDRDPLILLYTWPQMDIDAVLRDGTANAYSIMDFSPDGELLASVGKEPDYNLTIWNWKKHKILLRTSAFSFDVNAAMFSKYCPGQLTTAGAAHIKFWKMAETFTGLKLKGDLGRFGKTEICDVLGVYPMPDEKVLSGCEWGNILVWEAGLVKLEVTQRGRKTCHKAPVIQFMLSPAGDEVTTISRDGCVRAWYWDTVEQADPPEDDPYVELNPVAETCVPGCQIMCLKHQKDMYWYAQDGNGGIWTVDIEIDKIECNHNKISTYHSGEVIAMVVLRLHPILLTVGCDGALQAYSTDTQLLLARYQFPCAVTCMLYPPHEVDPSGRIILIGFSDGVMRTLLIHPDIMQTATALIDVRIHSALTIHSEDSVNPDALDLISLLKPHSKSLTQITINNQNTLLVTSGEDSTIFMYELKAGTPFTLNRLGFIITPSTVSYMTWKPEEERVLLLCGPVGFLMEVVLPDAKVQKYSEITTFKLEFVSSKQTQIKKHFMRHRPFPQEEDLASIDEEALKAKEEAEKEKDDEEEEWIGEIQLIEDEAIAGTTLTWAAYCEEGVWTVQQDTGALLLVRPGLSKIFKYGPIPEAWTEDITTLKFICDGAYLMLGTNTGYIRVVRMPVEDEDNEDYHYLTWKMAQQKLLRKLKGRRLAKEETQPTPRIDFNDYYYLPMHDFYTGAITCIEISADGRRLFTCGKDGNIFSYTINFPEPLIPKVKLKPIDLPKVPKMKEPSTIDGELMSHEQLKQKEEYDKKMAIANAHKKLVRDHLAELTVEYNKLIKANKALPYSQQIDVTLDPRPLIEQEKELDEAKALTKRKLAHQLEASDLGYQKMYTRNIIQLDVFPFTLKAIRDPNIMLRPLRQKNLSKAFYEQFDEVHQKMAEAALRGRRADSIARRVISKKASWGPPRVASFLLGLPPRAPHPLKKAIRNYYQRLNRHHLQFIEWHEHSARKPDPNAMPPGAAEALKEAEATIGNRLLKTQPDYVAPPGHNTQLRICTTRKEIHDNKHEFNEKVLELRQHKLRLVDRMKSIGDRLGEIRLEIPHSMVKHPPQVPAIDEALEFPEKNLEIKPEVTVKHHMAMTKKIQQDRRKSLAPSQPRSRPSRVARFVPITVTRPLAASWELLKSKQDQETSATEIEIRERRVKRHLYEQDLLLADAAVSIQQFDSRLRELQRERIRVQEKNQLLELHLYQLHREMNVLNRFEAHEDRLAERVYVKLMQIRGVQEQVEDCEHRIDEHYTEKEMLDAACQEIQSQFKRLVHDNKFADFLRRIFKKKYRPPRDRDDDESSESESESSSSEEEDDASLDSRDIGPIRLDPNVCPEGCEQEIYDKTYDLRNTRHRHEQEMIEKDRLVELLRKDIEAHNKVKRTLTIQLDKRKNDLREFMMEKQNCMNEVEQVVVLRYDQLRASALRGCTGPQGLSNTVVFPERLLHKLRQRVLELRDEIKLQRKRHKINRTHLFRMNIDLRAMEEQASELRAKMRDVLTRKLGKPRRVDRTLDDLLRQMARRHKFTSAVGTMPQMQMQIRQWHERLGELEKKYLKELDHYSERLRLASALQADILPQKPCKDPNIMVGSYEPEQYQRDVVRLRIVRSQQLHQIAALKEEIKGLRTKPFSGKLDVLRRPPPLEAEQSELCLSPIKRTTRHTKKKYFPITPIGSQTQVVQEVNVMSLLFDCLDAMRVTRDDAEELLKDLTDQLPEVLAGTKSRFEVIDSLVRKWLLKHGGDPSLYKKQTRAFDTLAALADRLIKEHIAEMEGAEPKELQVMKSLEDALREVSDKDQSLHKRLGPAIAALIHTTDIEELATQTTMTLLVNSLIEGDHRLTAESIDRIQPEDVIEDIRECGVRAPINALRKIVKFAVDCLRAQLIGPEEAKFLDAEVTKALSVESISKK
ncbi:PREDICTED: cilia- and flagella-associated protein 44 [Papilio polytes]|uniref:cilia- and flagella-associated protein 44 n=1 Tax=Papilio polytes TaxID=76194 RepID=UPI000675E40B|nr:PREDICTED: cilia- and flagella-associated protein 44 [Papilio polytes]